MRTLSSGLTTLQNARSRRPVSKFIVRDIRLRFDSHATPGNPFYPTFAEFIDDVPIHPATTGDKFVPMDHVQSGTSQVSTYTGPLYAASTTTYGGVSYGQQKTVTDTDSIVGIVGYNDQMYSRVVADPTVTANWANWGGSSFGGCVSGSRPSIIKEGTTLSVFTHESGYIKRYQSTDGGTTWGSATNIISWPISGYKTNAGIAAISSDELFVCGVTSAAAHKLSVWRIKVTTATKWDNDWFSDTEFTISAMTHFDACSMGTNKRMILFQGNENGQTFSTLWSDGVWSTPRPVLPLDLVDTTSQFRANSIENIQDVIWVTGHLKRPGSVTGYDIDMDVSVRTKDGEHWTFDRNAFVTQSETRGQMLLANKQTTSYDGETTLSTSADPSVYYPGTKTVYKAPSTYMIDPANDNPNKKMTLDDSDFLFNWGLNIPAADGAPSQVQASLAARDSILVWPTEPSGSWNWNDGHAWPATSITGIYYNHPVVKGGSLVWIYAGYDGTGSAVKTSWPTVPSSSWIWTDGTSSYPHVQMWPDEGGSGDVHQLLDICDIDQLSHSIADGARQVQMSGRGFVGKALKQTTAMQDYLFTPQIKWADDLDADDHFARLSGTVTTNSGVLECSDTSNITHGWWTGPEGIGSGMIWPLLKVSFKLNHASNTGGLVLNGKDGANHWYLKASTSGLSLVERVAGTDNVRASSSGLAFAIDAYYDIMVLYRGGTFYVWQKTTSASLGSSNQTWASAITYTHATSTHPSFDRVEGLVGFRADAVSAGTKVEMKDPEGYDQEYDKNTDWLFREIATIGGVLDHYPKYIEQNASQTFTAGGSWWATATEEHVDFTMNIGLLATTTQHVYIAFRASAKDWTAYSGYAIGIKRNSSDYTIALIKRDGTAYNSATDDIDILTIPFSRANDGELSARLVVIGKFITLYLGGYPAMSWYDTTFTAAGYWGIYTDQVLTITNIEMPELHEWREALIADIGQPLGSALGQIIQERYIKVFGDGMGIRYSSMSSRDDLGVWDHAVFKDQVGPSDAERISMVRAIGTEVIESIDFDIAKAHGLVYAHSQNSSARTAAKLKVEADRLLNLSEELSEQHQVELAALLEMQPEDKANLKYTSSDALWAIDDNFVINDLTYNFSPANASASLTIRKLIT